MLYGGIAITLALFWWLLSGHAEPLLLGFGLLSVGLVVWLVWRMDRTDGAPGFIPARSRLLNYGLWLLGAVVQANLDVARRIWHPALPIDPVWRRLDTKLRSPLSKTLYANSITLTPGTLTTAVAGDHLWVHCLSKAAFDDLAAGEMERRIERLEL